MLGFKIFFAGGAFLGIGHRLQGRWRHAREAWPEDKHEWLEEVLGEKPLEWVKEQNAHTLKRFGEPTTLPLYEKILAMLESKDKIPDVAKIEDLYYNFWQDDEHVRGIWRRTTLEEFKKKEPAWETVLDLDELGITEGESWVWGGATVLDEGPGKPRDLVLLYLSRGGADAKVVREFSLNTKEFVPLDAGGFSIPEAKTSVSYKSRDVLLVGSDFGPGSLTDSGYARVFKEWQRGTPLAEAPVVYEGEQQDVAAFHQRSYERRGYIYDIRGRAVTFYTTEQFVKIVASPDGDHDMDYIKLEVPEDAQVSTFADQLLMILRSEFVTPAKTFVAGALIATNLEGFLKDASEASWTELFVPSTTVSLDSFTCTANLVVLQLLDKVKSRLEIWQYTDDGSWTTLADNDAAESVEIAALNVRSVDKRASDEVWITRSSFLEPSTLFLCDLAAISGPSKVFTERAVKLKALPDFFRTDGLKVEQFEAVSADGTRIPYFQIGSSRSANSTAPTLLYGYGGFEVSLTPHYAGTIGQAWLEDGGTFVEANIRGGGEFGPSWHQAALKENRQKAYEDFEAVARDLIERGVTSADRLGCMGGSNGGLLVGNMLVRSPQTNLFGAVVCQVPLLDMKKYHTLLAGASWMAEYGDPDDSKQWEFIQHFSPYHLLKKDCSYPPVLFTTSTRDDRVHPGHARKMVRRLLEEIDVDKEVYYYENIEGGHGGAADNKQRAFMKTLEWSFLWDTLGM